MTRNRKLLAAASGVALSVGGGGAAHAAGTTAGQTITNNVTVNYRVGGVDQTAQTDSDTITVDRKVNLTITETGNATTSVVPGSTAQVTTFSVTNTSNEVLDFRLAVSQPVGGAAPHGGTDSFDVTAPAIYRDTNANGVYDAGVDAAASFLDELAADASVTVFVVANVSGTQVNGDIATVALSATAREGGAAATEGAAITETTGANTNAKDTVFADLAGTDDASRDGAFSARDDYTVSAALLTVVKNSRVTSDPFNFGADPKMIPGATVEYCIAVSNGAGGATATGVAISDTLPADTSFVPGSIVVDATVTGGVCSGGSAGGSFAAGTVTGSLSDIAGGATRGLRFQVTIN